VDSAAQPATPPVVVIGASAGGVEALVKLVGGLTDELGDELSAQGFERRARGVTERAEVLGEAIGRDETGQHLLSLDIGLPVEKLRQTEAAS
jgi:hypothetical protein